MKLLLLLALCACSGSPTAPEQIVYCKREPLLVWINGHQETWGSYYLKTPYCQVPGAKP